MTRAEVETISEVLRRRVPLSTMYEPRETARRIVQAKITASQDAFNKAVDAESLEAWDRLWRASSGFAEEKTA
jgi:hypothetical protein